MDHIKLAPKPKSFKKDSLDLLLKTQWELVVLKARVDEARINPISDKELETAIALTGLKATLFERRLEMYEYHHGETKENEQNERRGVVFTWRRRRRRE